MSAQLEVLSSASPTLQGRQTAQANRRVVSRDGGRQTYEQKPTREFLRDLEEACASPGPRELGAEGYRPLRWRAMCCWPSARPPATPGWT